MEIKTELRLHERIKEALDGRTQGGYHLMQRYQNRNYHERCKVNYYLPMQKYIVLTRR